MRRSRSRSPKNKHSSRKSGETKHRPVTRRYSDAASPDERSPSHNDQYKKHRSNGASSATKNAPPALGNDKSGASENKPGPGAFSNFPDLPQKSIDGLIKRGINELFPVQYFSFNKILQRNDMIVRDLTGSGKTLGFCLPTVEYLRKNKLFGQSKPQCMILAPTRELALQIAKELNALKHYDNEYKVLTVYGGVPIDDQTWALRKGVDIFVGTTGRVLDHMERKNFDFSNLKSIILDEADRMLALGFKEDIEKIMETIKNHGPKDLQVLLFSATIPRWVRTVAEEYLSRGYDTIDLAQNLKNKTSRTVNHLAINCPYHNRMSALADILICYGSGQTIVFTSTKQEANSLLLTDKIKKDIEVMHGDIAQNQREVTLKRFKEQKFNVLVATDVASRGLDIPNVDLVIQVEPPKDTETYIHRAGRTARAGRSGTCITFYTMKQKSFIQMIENKAGIAFQKIGIPQPDQVIKASSRDTIRNLAEVNADVLGLFEEAADDLIAQHDGDAKMALCKTLAYLSGQYKQVLEARSLLNGQQGCVTFQIQLEKPFYSVSLIWNILRRHLPEDMSHQVKGMRAFKDMTGACFDLPDDNSQRVIDIFANLAEQQRIDFKFSKASELPELREDDNSYGGGQGGYGGNQMNSYGGRGGGYGQRPAYGQNGGRGGYGSGGPQTRSMDRGYQGGGGNQQWGGQNMNRSYGGQGGQQSYGGGQQQSMGGSRGNQDSSVFVGNLGFEADQRSIEDLFGSKGIKPLRIRVLKDDQGQSKGAAFVDFENSRDAQDACKMDGSDFGKNHRRLRINPAGQKPGGR